MVVLAVLAAALIGATAALLLTRPPANDSPEAGFARDMMVHHAQAVQMAEIVRDRTGSDDVRLLASDIALTQQAQIGIMQGWLQSWGLPTTGTQPAMAWMGHPMHGGPMPGMASPYEIDRLSKIPPGRADVLFLRLMIVHHRAAIPMAQAILKRTDEPYVRQLAQSIILSQRAEIGNMKAVIEAKVGDSAEVDLEPQNGSGTTGKATLSKTDGGGVKVVLEVRGLPRSTKSYLAHIHPGTCGEGEEASSHDHTGGEHEASAGEIEYALAPVEPEAQGDGSSTTVVHHVTLEGLLSGDPEHVNVHEPGSGEPPPVTCADLNEAL
jgi:uncharacterized protein (DUF305 family)